MAWNIPLSVVGRAEAFPGGGVAGGGKEPLSPWCVHRVLLSRSLLAKQVLLRACTGDPSSANESTSELCTRCSKGIGEPGFWEAVPAADQGWVAALGAEPPKQAMPGLDACGLRGLAELHRRALEKAASSRVQLFAAWQLPRSQGLPSAPTVCAAVPPAHGHRTRASSPSSSSPRQQGGKAIQHPAGRAGALPEIFQSIFFFGKKVVKSNGSCGGILSKCQHNLCYITAKCDNLNAWLLNVSGTEV